MSRSGGAACAGIAGSMSRDLSSRRVRGSRCGRAARRGPRAIPPMRGSPWIAAPDGTLVPRLVSSAEAAELLGVSDTAVRGLCRRGLALPRAIRFANQWLIPIGDVDRRHRATRGRGLTPGEVRARGRRAALGRPADHSKGWTEPRFPAGLHR